MNAREVAAGVEPGQEVPWRILETEALSGFPKVAKKISPPGYGAKPTAGRRFVGLVGGILLVIGVIVFSIGYFFPSIVGVAILVAGRGGQASAASSWAVPVAGVIFAWAGVALVIDGVVWWVHGHKVDGFAATKAIVALVLGAISIGVLSARGSADDVPGWQAWAVIVAGVCVIAVVYLVLLLISRAKEAAARRASPIADDGLPVSPARGVARALRPLTDADRAGITADIDGAITDLEARGVITDADAASARKAQVGALARRMAAVKRRSVSSKAASADPGSMGTPAH